MRTALLLLALLAPVDVYASKLGQMAPGDVSASKLEQLAPPGIVKYDHNDQAVKNFLRLGVDCDANAGTFVTLHDVLIYQAKDENKTGLKRGFVVESQKVGAVREIIMWQTMYSTVTPDSPGVAKLLIGFRRHYDVNSKYFVETDVERFITASNALMLSTPIYMYDSLSPTDKLLLSWKHFCDLKA